MRSRTLAALVATLALHTLIGCQSCPCCGNRDQAPPRDAFKSGSQSGSPAPQGVPGAATTLPRGATAAPTGNPQPTGAYGGTGG
ncbi:hypothetical protein [Frigoriglobus tundricola]|uniref:Uncharacterized protein n=1 Tax=Frigoriglobus tundricola TaxID=2774151 RepID=A0A6M5YYX9_9BACT|nr:hypothetical protein [Frigoriglobus tundricola]QJW98744.1 hypothetical protein FTUN_6339 [Frigoriglobus tundricola]